MPVSFTLNNTSEGVTVTKNAGELFEVTVRANGARLFVLSSNETLAEGLANLTTWDFYADRAANLNFGYNRANNATGTPDVYNPAITLGITVDSEIRGTYFFSVLYKSPETGLSTFRVKINIVSSGTAPLNTLAQSTTPDLSPWLDRSLFDLRFDLRTRDVTSAFLDAVKALKIGDSLIFAVLPFIWETAIVADVSALSLTIRAPDQFAEDDFLFKTVAGVTQVTVGDNKYYKLELTLDSDELRDWFDALNSANPLPNTAILRSVVAMAELRITWLGRVYTSETFDFPIQQPVTALT